jgi:predicted dehydrogenase
MLTAAVIGLGVGEQHILGYESDPRCRVTTLCDNDAEKLKEVAQRYPGRFALHCAEEVLRDPKIGVVSIASYDDVHSQQVITAIETGKHVFVEKPICLHSYELNQIVAALKSHPTVKLSSNFILRKVSRLRALKEKICTGTLGGIYYMEGDYDYGRLKKIKDGWRGKINSYSVMHGGGIHLIDLLCWLTEDLVEEVFAYGTKNFTRGLPFSGNDFIVSLLKFRKGTVAKITANFGCVTPHMHRLAIYGCKGTFQQGHNGGSYIFSRDGDPLDRILLDDLQRTHKGEILPSFVKSILDGSESDVTTQEVIDIMSISLAIEKSVTTGTPVNVTYAKIGPR